VPKRRAGNGILRDEGGCARIDFWGACCLQKASSKLSRACHRSQDFAVSRQGSQPKGILAAIEEAGAELRDLVWVQESYSVKVLRDGNYPVMRGTFVELDGKGLLYTNGSIPYYGTYPGLYDPRPLLLCPYKGHDSTISQIAAEVLALTKVNWNSTQMNQKLAIPIRAARAGGEVHNMRPTEQIVLTMHVISSDWTAGRWHGPSRWCERSRTSHARTSRFPLHS
jgi:hypothetical protein